MTAGRATDRTDKEARAAALLRANEWKEPTWRRQREIAQQGQVTLADIIELTGIAPDHSGMLSLLNVDENGFEFRIDETNIRGRPAKQQQDARHLVENGKLVLPCPPAALVAFAGFEAWSDDLLLPEQFIQQVQADGAARAFDQWADRWVDDLKEKGIAAAAVDYATFLKLTDFAAGGLSDDDFYALDTKTGKVTGVIMNPKVAEEWSKHGRDVMEVAADMQADIPLDFPTSAEMLIRWIRRQGGDVQLKVETVDEFAAALPTTAGKPVLRSKPTGKNKAAGIRGDRLDEEIQATKDKSPNATADEIMKELQGSAGKQGSCIAESIKGGVLWRRYDNASPEKLTLRDLKKRLKRKDAAVR